MFLHRLQTLVLDLFQELDARTARFRTVSGLQCPPGCGSCCLSDKVEATILEFLPLAISLMGSETGDRLLERLSRSDEVPAHCLLYDPTAREGHCTAYPFRGVVCRLFGFAGRLDRKRVPQLAVCRKMRSADPETASRAEALVAMEPRFMPLFADAGIRLSAMDPALGTRRLPINEALREALAKVEVMRLYTGTVNLVGEEAREEPLVPEELHDPLLDEFDNQAGKGGVH